MGSHRWQPPRCPVLLAASLEPKEDGGVRLRLFRAHSADDLERLGELERFCLQAVLIHGELTPEDLVEVVALELEPVSSPFTA